MNLTADYKLPCLPTPEHYLRRKRQTILTQYEVLNYKIKIIKYKLYDTMAKAKDLKADYEKIDYQLAEIDGRLKREVDIKTKSQAKKKVNKETSIGLTTEQIALIASALNIKIEG